MRRCSRERVSTSEHRWKLEGEAGVLTADVDVSANESQFVREIAVMCRYQHCENCDRQMGAAICSMDKKCERFDRYSSRGDCWHCGYEQTRDGPGPELGPFDFVHARPRPLPIRRVKAMQQEERLIAGREMEERNMLWSYPSAETVAEMTANMRADAERIAHENALDERSRAADEAARIRAEATTDDELFEDELTNAQEMLPLTDGDSQTTVDLTETPEPIAGPSRPRGPIWLSSRRTRDRALKRRVRRI